MEISPHETQVIGRPIGSRPSSDKILSSRDNREITFSEQRISVKLLHNPGGNQKTTYPRLQTIEQICTMPPFQDGRNTSIEISIGEGRFDMQNRLERRICSCSTTPPIQTFSYLPTPRYGIPIQIPCIWSKCSSPDIFQTNALCGRTIEKERNQIGLLLRRHMFSGEIKEGDEYECRGNLRTSEEPRFSYQLQEKQPTTTKTPRILRFSIQHFNDDNRTTSTKIEENNKSNKTSEEINHDLLMSMDCESYRKDDCSHTCNRRSSTPPPFSSKRFSTESSHPTSKLGRSVSPNKKKLRRSGMVGRIFRNQQWITNPQRRLQFTASSGYIRGRIRQWIRNKQRRNRDLRVLDPSRESNVNKRKRTTDSIDSPATSRRKISKQSHKDIFGQHDGNQIRDEGRRNSISDFTGFSSENPYNSQPVQNTITMCPYPGDQQHQSRSIKQNAKTAIRMDIAKVHIQSNSTQVGSIDDRCIRSSPQSSSTEILEYQAGPSSNANRCFQTTMAENRVVSTSTMEIGSSSAENVQEAEGEGSDIGGSILANTILVPNDIENDKEKTTDIPNLKNLAASRMEIIRQSMEKQNLDLTTINHLQHKHRKETINNYNRNWERWANWCSQQSPTINYLEYVPKNVLKYLVQNRHYSTSHLNGIRSSIASVFNVVYPSKPSIGQHHLIQDFFTAHKKQRVQIPTREEIEIWDLDILLKFIKAKYAHNDRLTIMELQYKTVLLLSIFTMWRPKSDISRLQHRDVLFQTENGRIQGVTLICRLPKEAQQKTISLGTIDTSDLCPVTTLYLFIQKTEGYRGKLPENQTLFLAYINEQKPTSCVSPNTVTGWIKNNMSQAGIDTTKYQPHSIRSAASTKAVQLGFKIDDVKKHANWSLNSNTFEKYYYKPNHTDRISTAIGNSMVNNLSENNTISGVRTEATSIGVGTTCNTDVAVVRTEDMVKPGPSTSLPWYKRILDLI